MIKFSCKHYNRLSKNELYDAMQLRQEVFVLEQNCPYVDADGKDLSAWHLFGKNDEGKLVVYTRLLPKGVSYENYASIGRVVTHQLVRGTGVGKILMSESIKRLKKLCPDDKIKIGAQAHLKKFYESFGFEQSGEVYDEDGIPHIPMILSNEQ